MPLSDSLQKMKKIKAAKPVNLQSSAAGLKYKHRPFDYGELKMPKDAQAELMALIGGGGGGGGGGRGGRGGGEDWEAEADRQEKALDLVAAKCLVLLAKKLSDAMDKVKELEEDEKLKASLGTKRYLQQTALKRDLAEAEADFKKCLKSSMGAVDAAFADEICESLLDMSRDEILKKFGINMTTIAAVWEEVDSAAGNQTSRE